MAHIVSSHPRTTSADYTILPSHEQQRTMSNYMHECEWLSNSVYPRADLLQPIDHIPNEILIEIMLFVRDAEPARWTRILRVSRRWLRVAVNTPMLWTRILLQENYNSFYASLFRAGHLCLDLCVSRSYMTSLAMDAVASHTSRLRKLSLREIPIQDHKQLHSFLRLGLPSLQKLELGYITSYINRFDTFKLELSPVYLPNLAYLSVNDIKLSISHDGPLKSLRRLRICHGLRLPAGVYMGAAFPRLLRGVPNLEELTLEHVPLSGYEAAIKVVLPRLRFLQVTGTDCFVHELLQLLDVPSHTHVRIQCLAHRCQWMDPPQGLLFPRLHASLSAPPKHMLPLLATVTKVDMTLMQNEHVLFGRGRPSDASAGSLVVTPSTRDLSECSVDNILDGGWGAIKTADLANIFRCSPVEELCVDVGAEEFSSIDWRCVFAAFPRLRSLRVLVVQPPDADVEDQGLALRMRMPSAYAVFAALDPAFDNPGSTETVPTRFWSTSTTCPDLRSLRFEGYVWIPNAMVQECLRNRMRVKGTHRLENLVLDPIWHGTERELEEINGWYEEKVGPMVDTVVFGIPG
ncbi:hypothetical protein C8Q80DRAFT_1275782 [Daedaleopsis nitida]|nr:hypothetical protein C8Q80DRAFT_1275782 [Daedaleopsis nitida]